MVNQELRNFIASDLSLVLKAGMFSSARARGLLKNLMRGIYLQSIYIPNPLRILRITNGVMCEFCYKKRVFYLRPQFPVFACWECLKRTEHNAVGSTGEQFDSLSARWHKVVYLVDKGHFQKQFYVAHRQACYHIFKHRSVCAYPTGTRYLKKIGNEYHQTTKRSGTTIKSLDAHEIMWTKPRKDTCGDFIGPLFSKCMVQELVRYIESTQPRMCINGHCANYAIEDYLRKKITDSPSIEQYALFAEVYEPIKIKADARAKLSLG